MPRTNMPIKEPQKKNNLPLVIVGIVVVVLIGLGLWQSYGDKINIGINRTIPSETEDIKTEPVGQNFSETKSHNIESSNSKSEKLTLTDELLCAGVHGYSWTAFMGYYSSDMDTYKLKELRFLEEGKAQFSVGSNIDFENHTEETILCVYSLNGNEITFYLPFITGNTKEIYKVEQKDWDLNFIPKDEAFDTIAGLYNNGI